MRIPITKPYITEREKELILKPLESGWLVQGPYVKELERLMCEYTGAKYAVAASSCTTAQFIASRCIGLEPGDEVIVPAFTWISTANAAEIFGAKPVFADIDLDTFNIDVKEIEKKITPKTKAIFPVNLFGLPADLPAIIEIAKKHNLKVVEDCACSLGGFIEGKHCGTFGDCGCFSFHPRKSITTGEGGMLVTNNQKIAEMARSLRDHGAVKTDFDRHEGKSGFLLSDYELLGYNYRMTDIQAALGVAQFEKVPEIMERKQELAKKFQAAVRQLGFLQAPFVPGSSVHGYQAYVTLFEPRQTVEAVKSKEMKKLEELHQKRNTLMMSLEEKGIATRQGTHAVHVQKYYKDTYGYRPEDYIHAYAAERLSLALPFFPGMTEEEIDYVITSLKEAY